MTQHLGPVCLNRISMIETMKLDEKKRGKPIKVFATFCPFCGSKYPEPSKD